MTFANIPVEQREKEAKALRSSLVLYLVGSMVLHVGALIIGLNAPWDSALVPEDEPIEFTVVEPPDIQVPEPEAETQSEEGSGGAGGSQILGGAGGGAGEGGASGSSSPSGQQSQQTASIQSVPPPVQSIVPLRQPDPVGPSTTREPVQTIPTPTKISPPEAEEETEFAKKTKPVNPPSPAPTPKLTRQVAPPSQPTKADPKNPFQVLDERLTNLLKGLPGNDQQAVGTNRDQSPGKAGEGAGQFNGSGDRSQIGTGPGGPGNGRFGSGSGGGTGTGSGTGTGTGTGAAGSGSGTSTGTGSGNGTGSGTGAAGSGSGAGTARASIGKAGDETSLDGLKQKVTAVVKDGKIVDFKFKSTGDPKLDKAIKKDLDKAKKKFKLPSNANKDGEVRANVIFEDKGSKRSPQVQEYLERQARERKAQTAAKQPVRPTTSSVIQRGVDVPTASRTRPAAQTSTPSTTQKASPKPSVPTTPTKTTPQPWTPVRRIRVRKAPSTPAPLQSAPPTPSTPTPVHSTPPTYTPPVQSTPSSIAPANPAPTSESE